MAHFVFIPRRPSISNRRDTRQSRTKCALDVTRLEDRALLSGPGDTTAPTTMAEIVSGHLGLNGFYTTPVTVDLFASDPDDAPNTLTTLFSVNGGAFVTGNSVTLTQNGTDTLRYFSLDPAGNVGAAQTLVVNIDTTAPLISSLTANPNVLWPPNHKLVAVTVTGRVTDASGPLPTMVSYQVIDEYGTAQPSGMAPVNANGRFSFTISLPASRLGQDKDGRLFTIDVTTEDQAGNIGAASTPVLVPHDMGHAFNFSQGGNTATPSPVTSIGTGNSGQNNNGGGHNHGRKIHGNGHQGSGASRHIGAKTGNDKGQGIHGNVLAGHGNAHNGNSGHGQNDNGNGHGHGHG
jgi:hypothetical protein